MPDWSTIWEWLFGSSEPGRTHPFRRRIRIAGPAHEFVFGPACADGDRMEFAQMLLRLDADPFKHSWPILPSDPPGLRWAAFGARKAIFQFDPSRDEILVLVCE